MSALGKLLGVDRRQAKCLVFATFDWPLRCPQQRAASDLDTMDFDPSMLVRSPGEVLLTDYLQPDATPLARFARRSGISLNALRKTTLEHRPISTEYALRLSLVTDSTSAYWLLLQARYDLALVSALREGRRPPR